MSCHDLHTAHHNITCRENTAEKASLVHHAYDPQNCMNMHMPQAQTQAQLNYQQCSTVHTVLHSYKLINLPVNLDNSNAMSSTVPAGVFDGLFRHVIWLMSSV